MNNQLLDIRQSPVAETVFSRSPIRESPVRAKIAAFGKLEEGWDFGEGGPAPSHVVNMALALCDFGELLGFEMDAFPGADGDISVDFYIGDELVQVLIDTDLTCELTHERGIGAHYDELAYHEDIPVRKVLCYLINFRAKGYACSWSSSEFYTERNTSPSLCDSIRIASRNANAMEQFHSLKSSAFITPAQKFTNTLVGTTKPLWMGSLSLFGSLRKTP